MASASSERRTQAERSALSERRILRAAARLFARQGFTRTTLAQIGQQAGYTGGLVSHRFGSKLQLLRAVVGYISARFYADQIQPAVAERSGIAALEAGVGAYLHELTAREERIRALYVLMGEALGPVPEVRPIFAELNRGFRATVQKWVESGIDAGELRRDVNSELEAAQVLGALRGVTLQWLMDPGCFDLDAVRASMVEGLRRRLATSERAA